MTPHMEWFYEYEKYDGGNVFLGNDSTTRIIGRGRVKLGLIDGRIRTLPGVLHIPGMAINLLSVRKMEDVGVKTIFEKGTCRMVRGAMVLMKGVWSGTIYNLLGITISDGCNNSIVPDIGVEEERTPIVSKEKVMLWHQRLGHIGEKGHSEGSQCCGIKGLGNIGIKAWLVAKGYSQVDGIDFGDIFFPVAKLTSIRFLLYIATAFDFEVEQMDVKTTFLHRDLEEENFMKQPEGYAVKGKKELVCKLKKSLYSLKQSPRMWYQKFDTYMLGLGFTRSKEGHCMYSKLIGDHLIFLVLYVDDMLLIGNNKEII
jgi:hypothetical protein